ncbi:Lysosomal alpha-mannosidase, partial [Dufourea novaeangliae]
FDRYNNEKKNVLSTTYNSYGFVSKNSKDAEYRYSVNYSNTQEKNYLQRSISADNVVIRSRGFKPSDRHDPVKRNFLENLTSKILHVDMESNSSTPVNLQKLLTPASDTEGVMQSKNRKMFASSYFYAPTHPTVEDQVELARRISHSLSDVKNMKSKGQSMYVNRKKRSVKWIHDGNGLEDVEEPSTPSQRDKIPLKCMMNPHGKVLDIHGIQALGEEVNIEPMPKNPEKFFNIVRDLNTQKGRGAEIFAKRRKRSEKWVVDKDQPQTPSTPGMQKTPVFIRKQEMNGSSKFSSASPFSVFAPEPYDEKPFYNPFTVDLSLNDTYSPTTDRNHYRCNGKECNHLTEVKKIYLREVAVGTDNDFPIDKYRSSTVEKSRRATLEPDIERYNNYHAKSNNYENASMALTNTNRRNHNHNKASLSRSYYPNTQGATNKDSKNYIKEQRVTECVQSTINNREKIVNGQRETDVIRVDNEGNEYTPVPVKQLIQEFEKTCRPVLQYKQISPKVIPIVQQCSVDNDLARFFETHSSVKYNAEEDHRRPVFYGYVRSEASLSRLQGVICYLDYCHESKELARTWKFQRLSGQQAYEQSVKLQDHRNNGYVSTDDTEYTSDDSDSQTNDYGSEEIIYREKSESSSVMNGDQDYSSMYHEEYNSNRRRSVTSQEVEKFCNNGGDPKYVNTESEIPAEAKSLLLSMIASQENILETIKHLRNTPVLDNLLQGVSPDFKFDEICADDGKFMYVETAFLWKWWLRQDEKVREDVRNLINEGRLEIISGGWSMNDEAVTHYHSIVDQFTWGFRRLNDTFGSCARPKIGWQIDPFGHSREQASIFAQLGFDGMFLGRLDYQDKKKRLRDKTMEFIWKGSPSLGSRGDLFTVALYNTYSPPPGFCFDVLCNDQPIVDDPASPDYNVEERVEQFLSFAQRQASAYKTNNIILTMGEDFNYQHAEMWFTNLDRLIRYIRERKDSNVNIFYSTPSCYMKAVHDSNLQWSTKSDDFFPYASDGHSYWTGYFSSRPTIKFFERMGNNLLQISKQLSVLTGLKGYDEQLQHFREAMGVMQHHDAITGTEKQLVANDYARLLYKSMEQGADIVSTAIRLEDKRHGRLAQDFQDRSRLESAQDFESVQDFESGQDFQDFQDFCSFESDSKRFEVFVRVQIRSVPNPITMYRFEAIRSVPNPITTCRKWKVNGCPVLTKSSQKMYSCMQLNISSCAYTENQDSMLTIYNPLSYKINVPIRVPVQEANYTVIDIADGSDLTSQLVPIPNAVQNLPGRESAATHELVFFCTVPALGYKSYKVVRILKDTDEQSAAAAPISNEFYDVFVDDDGQIVVEWKKQQNMSMVQAFHYYEGMTGNNEVFQNRSSGAYIFRPKGVLKNFTTNGSYKIYKGPVVHEIHQTINDWISQVIRIYNGKEYIEFDWLVGPIPVKDKIGKEIVTKYSSTLASNGEFYTDSNGREMLKRMRNYRPTWNLRLEEGISGNYYPVTSKISLKDEEEYLKLSVLTDRAQGGTSMKDGEIELMLHRRLLVDDAFGVGEALNESAYGEGLVVRGSHYVFGGSIKNLDEFMMKEKALTLQTLLRPWITVTPHSQKSGNDEYVATPQRSGLTKPLPPNVHILSLEPWKDDTVLLRLEHIFEVGEAENLSRPVEVNIQDMFSTFTILSIEETTMGGNQWLKDMNRMKWHPETNDVLQERANTINEIQIEEGVINVLLRPMEIRTFIIKISPRHA